MVCSIPNKLPELLLINLSSSSNGRTLSILRLLLRWRESKDIYFGGFSDKSMQNEKELIHLAGAKRQGGTILYLCGEY